MLRRYSESIGHAIEECKHRNDVHRLGDLLLRPARVAQFLDILRRGAIRRIGNDPGVVQQHALGGREARIFEFAFENRRDALIIGSLDTQEVSVAVQSIWAAVQVGDVAGDHLLMAADQVTFGEMNTVGKIDDLPQEIGPRTKALDDARNLCPAGNRPPVIVGRKCRP